MASPLGRRANSAALALSPEESFEEGQALGRTRIGHFAAAASLCLKDIPQDSLDVAAAAGKGRLLAPTTNRAPTHPCSSGDDGPFVK
jgi:hypothetical protein